MASRRVHHDGAPATSQERRGGVPEPGEGGTARTPTTLREVVDRLPDLPRFRVEIINGRVIVSPRSTPRQSWTIALLVEAFLPLARERGWRTWPELDVCISWTREPLIPDFAMGPADAPRRGEREILSDGLILVAEVVSAGSVREDREDKPLLYARGRVPFLLVVDAEADPRTVVLYGDPGDDGYRTVTTVKMGELLRLPDPIGLTLDTSIFLDA
ncbi:Uma2 family endonuclease [Streptosporangium sp. NPDC004379]|uniref:Uma2 family endonuclease n=1 Tax=Streptosporangium sp. NPDC004379 TaxID=3366189 RepID=UPI0036797E5A